MTGQATEVVGVGHAKMAQIVRGASDGGASELIHDIAAVEEHALGAGAAAGEHKGDNGQNWVEQFFSQRVELGCGIKVSVSEIIWPTLIIEPGS